MERQKKETTLRESFELLEQASGFLLFLKYKFKGPLLQDSENIDFLWHSFQTDKHYKWLDQKRPRRSLDWQKKFSNLEVEYEFISDLREELLLLLLLLFNKLYTEEQAK